ncbi:MAG: OsmC family protein [Candidatus Aminicenantes bacterium]|nr:MAG: OsmC family protein [Candidatus Aminicenantes bacterium]
MRQQCHFNCSLVKKDGKNVSGFQVNAKGLRQDQHPTSFHKIFLEFVLNSRDAMDADVQKAIQLSEESICPVWAMVKGNVEIVTEYKIIA